MIAPSSGLFGWSWYAQARQAEEPRHAALASTETLKVAPAPSAFISHVSSAVAGSRNLAMRCWGFWKKEELRDGDFTISMDHFLRTELNKKTHDRLVLVVC